VGETIQQLEGEIPLLYTGKPSFIPFGGKREKKQGEIQKISQPRSSGRDFIRHVRIRFYLEGRSKGGGEKKRMESNPKKLGLSRKKICKNRIKCERPGRGKLHRLGWNWSLGNGSRREREKVGDGRGNEGGGLPTNQQSQEITEGRKEKRAPLLVRWMRGSLVMGHLKRKGGAPAKEGRKK